MPMINIEDAYILGETGAQVDKVTGLFTKDEGTTEEEKEFAQLNIGASGGGGGGGRNLLDNPWFTVNQRGASGTISTNGYSIDRWYTATGTVISTNYITVPSSGGAVKQYLELNRLIDGNPYTFTALLADGRIFHTTGVLNSSASGWQISMHLITDYLWVGIRVNASKWEISLTSGNGVSIRAVKLELGTVSTLANDAPPDYGTELAKCQRYFIRYKTTGTVLGLGFGYAHSTTNATGIISLPCVMRATPSIAVSGEGVTLQNGVIRYNLTSPSVSGIVNNMLLFTSPYSANTGTAVAGTAGGLLLRGNSTVDLSAET